MTATIEPAKLFDGLRRVDGTPNVQARQDAIDKIVDSLSHNEIRNLRSRVNAINFDKDIWLDLPVELLLHVAEYLDFGDLMTTRQVSHAWRGKFITADLSMGIIKVHFRTQWEQSDLRNATAKESLVNWLPSAAMKRLRKQRGRYLSTSAYHYQRDGTLMPTHYKIEHQYDSGRIAYRFGESFIVQALNEGQLAQVKVYLETSRTPIRPGEWLLSNDFLIAQGLGRLNLIAWSLTNDDIHRVRLPSSTKYMSAQHHQVGVITQSNEVLFWKVGESLTSIQQPDIEKSEGLDWSPEAIVFHLLNDGHFFIFYHNWPGAGVLVQEYVHGACNQTHRADFTDDLSDSRMKNIDLHIVRTVGTQGLCTIGWNINLNRFVAPPWVKTFNLYTHQFGTIKHPHSLRDLPDSVKESACPFQPWKNLEVDFSPSHRDVAEHCASAILDDDFEILFGDYGYVVWAYDDIQLPIAGSLSDESMQVPSGARPLPLSRRPRHPSMNR